MSGCTQAGKPLISILMAVYEPRLDWLREQLESLEKQSYPNLRLYVRDDCSPTVPFEEIEGLVRECIRSFPYEMKRNEKNLGSNGTFEQLTREAEGEYFAYCDQDDVWLPEKLEVLQEELEKSGALLACSDMYIIDGAGKQVADSITKVRRRHRFLKGENLTAHLMVRNFIVGCTMLVYRKVAQEAVPFKEGYIHDQWIGIVASSKGCISVVQTPLICYRQHSNNQTGVLTGIHNKEDYLSIRIEKSSACVKCALKRLDLGGEQEKQIEELISGLDARARYMRAPNWRDLKKLWGLSQFSWEMRLFESVFPFLPPKLLKRLFQVIQTGLL